MSKPYIHSVSSAKKFGGKPEDYLPIHNLMDLYKSSVADARGRVATHNAFFVGVILEKIFGTTITNSDGKVISVRDIGEQHVLEDYAGKFIPTLQDFIEGMPMEEWMIAGRGNPPPSYRKLEGTKKVIRTITWESIVKD